MRVEEITPDAITDLIEALLSVLNVEGAARIGAESGALSGLDTRYHFDKVRQALKDSGVDAKYIADN